MIRKPTWILLAVFIVLIGVALYLQKNPIKSGAELTPSPTPSVSILKDWTTNDIVQIDYQDSQGAIIQLKQVKQGQWSLLPDDQPVDLGKVEEIRTQLLDTQVMTTMDGNYDLASIGVDKPVETITLTNTNGKKAAIQIGNKTPIATGYYIRINQNPPVVVNNYAIEGVIDLLKKANILGHTPTPEQTPSLDVTPTP
jgi:hypothetical protein